MVNPSSGHQQQPSEQQPRTTEEVVDIVNSLMRIQAKYEAPCATLGVQSRFGEATLEGRCAELDRGETEWWWHTSEAADLGL